MVASNLPALTYKKPNSLDKFINTWVRPIFDNWVNSATRPGLQLSGKWCDKINLRKRTWNLFTNYQSSFVFFVEHLPVFVQRCKRVINATSYQKKEEKKKDLYIILFFSL